MKGAILSARDESGSSRLKTVVTLAILGALVYGAFQLVPIHWDHYSFREAVKEKVEFAFVHHPLYTQESLENEIFALLDDLGAEYEEEDVIVEVYQMNKEIYVSVRYWRSHDLPLYQNPKEFRVEVENY